MESKYRSKPDMKKMKWTVDDCELACRETYRPSCKTKVQTIHICPEPEYKTEGWTMRKPSPEKYHTSRPKAEMTAVVPIHLTQSGSSDSSDGDDDNGAGEDVKKAQSKWRRERESGSEEQGGNVGINISTVQDEFLNRIHNLRNNLMGMKVTPVSDGQPGDGN